jgi:hypothetical protein
MPRAPKEVKRPVGCPPKEIDWIIVDEFLIAGCPGTKIADAIGVCADTLYDRCEKDKGVNFSAYSQQKKTTGDALLHKAQFDKAIGKTESGDNTLLIWLGKTRLEQKESMAVTVAPEIEKNFKSFMEELAEMQKDRHNSSQQTIESEEI